MKFIALAIALVISSAVMATEHGGGDGGSGTFDRAMQHNDAAMAKYKAKH